MHNKDGLVAQADTDLGCILKTSQSSGSGNFDLEYSYGTFLMTL